MTTTPTWRTRAADVTKPDYRESKPQNTASNIKTDVRSGGELVGEVETKQY